ncbi:MAG: DUF192 domain-containing protein [Parcubacteria group bacterium]|nr:DUF192 domain-containing protein [Parcubacteria group bacterium]
MSKYLGVLIFLVLAVVFARHVFFDANTCGATLPTFASLSLGGAFFDVEIAGTAEERACGLSRRASLPKDRAMLFMFPESGLHGIWMKDMHFPIDILWLDKDLVVVDSARDVSPDSYPTVFHPKREARYVLELSAGAADVLHLKEGDKVTIPN